MSVVFNEMKRKSIVLFLLLLVSGVSAFWFWGAAWAQYVELGCDTIEVAIAVRDNPERFEGLKFHRAEPKPFAEGLIARHKCLGPLVGWGILSLVVFIVCLPHLDRSMKRKTETQQRSGRDVV